MGKIENNKVCRSCLSLDEEELLDCNLPVDSSTSGCNLTYASWFEECAQLSPLEDETNCNYLCSSCVSELQITYNFVKRARDSDQVLRSQLKDKLRESVADENCSKNANMKIDYANILVSDNDDDEVISEPTTSFYQIEVIEVTEALDNEIKQGEVFVAEDASNSRFSDRSDEMEVESKRVNIKPKRLSKNCVLKKQSSKSQSVNPVKGASQEQEFYCEQCNKSYSNNKYYRKHMSRHSSENCLCHICPRTFNSKEDLKKHLLTHDENRERNFKCEHCDLKFHLRSAYRKHKETHNPNRKPLFQCNECDKSFLRKDGLVLHQRFHSGELYDCKFCEKRYARLFDLQAHLRVHSGDTPFKCPHCDKSFNHSGVMRNHIKSDHEGQRYKCDICFKEYKHHSSLMQHTWGHIGFPLKCALCDKGYKKIARIRRHMGSAHKITEAEEVEKLIIREKRRRANKNRLVFE